MAEHHDVLIRKLGERITQLEDRVLWLEEERDEQTRLNVTIKKALEQQFTMIQTLTVLLKTMRDDRS
jgi:hypothetical protein